MRARASAAVCNSRRRSPPAPGAASPPRERTDGRHWGLKRPPRLSARHGNLARDLGYLFAVLHVDVAGQRFERVHRGSGNGDRRDRSTAPKVPYSGTPVYRSTAAQNRRLGAARTRCRETGAGAQIGGSRASAVTSDRHATLEPFRSTADLIAESACAGRHLLAGGTAMQIR